jgi:phosphatidate phosphatase APP1
MLLNNAHSHVPFEGVAEFYRGLELGPDEKGHNPIFYVSSSPWNFYDLFDSFMDFHGLPRGPIFLKNFGFKEGKALRADHSSYKMEIIQSLLDLYPNLPFILAGDSGQMDPEIYRDVATVHGSRIRAIYLRDVSSPKRDRVVHGIAGEIEARGIPVLLAERTLEAGDHALEHGFISPAALEEIRTAHSEAAAAG